MDRSASAAFLTELLKSRSEPCHLVEFEFDDGTIRVTDAWKNIAWGNAETYFGLSAGSYNYPAARIRSFSRAAAATYVDGGVLKYAAANEPRYEDGLLLIEDEATNLCTYASAYNGAGWNRYYGCSVITATGVLGPDGTTEAQAINFDGVTSSSQLVSTSVNLTIGLQYTVSFWAWQDGANGTIAGGVYIYSGGVKGTRVNPTTTRTRYEVSFVATASYLLFVEAQAAASGFYLFGVDVELGSAATSYIPTTSAPVTRDADVCTIYDLNTWNANGYFLSFSGLRETFDMQIPTVTGVLSAVDQSWIAIALTKEYTDRPMHIYKAFIDYVNGVVSDPLLIFDGRMDAMPIMDDPDGGTCTIAVSATNQWSDFERRPGRHTNNNEQQALFAGDKFFERAGQSNREIKWGAL